MNGILQILEYVGQNAPPAELALIEKGRRSGAALMRILNSILDYTRLSHGSDTVSKGTVSLSQVCKTIVELHNAAAATKGLQLTQRLDLGPIDLIVIDEVKLFEIINNLVSNAVKFTERGFVEVGLHVESREGKPSFPAATLHVTVRDTGIGVPADDLTKIFTPFYQVDSGDTRKVGGTGLGLSIVRELAAVLGGSVTLDSRQGIGTVAMVEIPVELVDLASAADSKHALEPSIEPNFRLTRSPPDRLTGRVLLVEDNELNAYLAVRMLDGFGLEITVAEHGRDALDQMLKTQYDIVLMDCRMPVMNGFEATREIRRREAMSGTTAIPIIAITANTLLGDRQKCLAAGMNDYIGKPYSEAQLHQALSNWMGFANPRTAAGSSIESAPLQITVG